MKPPIEYRQHRPASSSGRTPDFDSGKGGSNPSAGTKIAFQGIEIIPDVSGATDGGAASFVLAHKRAVKAAQMRRWRAKKAGK